MQRNFCLFSVTSRGRTAYYYNDLMRGVSSLVMKYSMAERKLTDMGSGCRMLQKTEYMRRLSDRQIRIKPPHRRWLCNKARRLRAVFALL